MKYAGLCSALLAAVVFGASLRAAEPANPPAGVAKGKFPTMSVSYLNPATIHTNAISYQLADYDAKRHQVIFYPYGRVTSPLRNSGVLLTYDVRGQDFSNTRNWTAADLTKIIGPSAINFGGGFLDDAGDYAYLPPGQKVDKRVRRFAVTVRVNLAKAYADPNDRTAYEAIDLRTLPRVPAVGSFSGVFADGYAYFCPTLDVTTGELHGILVRYNSHKSFSDSASWEWHNLHNIVTPADPDLGGMQSMAYKKPYVYLIPFLNGSLAPGRRARMATKLVRYDTTKEFQSAAAYETCDLSALPFPPAIRQHLRGFTGAVVVGDKVVLVPWGSRDLKMTESVALIHDATKPINEPSAWQYIDLTRVNPKAGGYQGGWLDKNGFVFFVPTHNFNYRPAMPPFVAWNSKLPFAQSSSWTSYPAPARITWLTGAAYDPDSNTAWLSPYGIHDLIAPALIVQVQEGY